MSKLSPENVTRTPTKTSAKASFTEAAGGSGVSVSPGKGGVNIGTPTKCSSTRAHKNVKSSY